MDPVVKIETSIPPMAPNCLVIPRLRREGQNFILAYPIAGEANHYAVVQFKNVVSAEYGDPNDQGLYSHPLYNKGLKHYQFHHVKRDSMDEESESIIATFREGTFEVITPDFEVIKSNLKANGPQEALNDAFGPGPNIPLV